MDVSPHMAKRSRDQLLCLEVPPLWSELDKGCSPLFLLPLPLFPSLLLRKGKGNPSPSRTPHTWRATSRAGLSLPPLYTGAGGHL